MKLRNSICALATPFTSEHAIDFSAFIRLLNYQITGGTSAVVVAGSTGEAHALDDAEYDRLLSCAVEHVNQRIPVIAGTGGANTRKTLATTHRAKALGADAALVVTPYYVRPTQEGLYRHYSEIAENGGLPIILYNVPGRTGCDLLPETVAKLCHHRNIVGIKEAYAATERMEQLFTLQHDNFDVLSGDDATCMRAMQIGAQGVISVAANIIPSQFSQLCQLSRTGNQIEAAQLNKSLYALYELLGMESNPIPVKYCLCLLGIGEPYLRLPLTALSAKFHERARQVVAPFINLTSTLSKEINL